MANEEGKVDFLSTTHQESTPTEYLTESQVSGEKPISGISGFSGHSTRITIKFASNLFCMDDSNPMASEYEDEYLGKQWGYAMPLMDSPSSQYDLSQKFVKIKLELVLTEGIVLSDLSVNDLAYLSKALIFNNCVFRFRSTYWSYSDMDYNTIMLNKDEALSPDGNEIIWKSTTECIIDGESHQYGYVHPSVTKHLQFTLQVVDNYWEQ